jgi:ParB/RepB/Spo0J family partition protein
MNRNIKSRAAAFKSPVRSRKTRKATTDAEQQMVSPVFISTAEIAFSPLNHRGHYDEIALAQLAEDVKLHGILSALMVRPIPDGSYELVFGERRLRAAMLAKISLVPAIIRELTDEQVIELQLVENMQREDAHPLYEAKAIAKLMDTYKSLDDVALRVGKSKQFIHSRLKLACLIEPLQEVLLAAKISLSQAVALAALDEASQQEVFDVECKNWQQDGFELYNFNYLLSRYRYDLKRAPFNIKDKKLVAEAGACTTCPYNSATLKSLFPEYAKEATCTNRNCYGRKCNANLLTLVNIAVAESQPNAILYQRTVSDRLQQIIDTVPELQLLPTYNQWEVQVVHAPEPPDKEDYIDYDEEENEMPDEAAYEQAVLEYEQDLEAYQQKLQDGSLLTGLRLSGDSIECLLFDPHSKEQRQQSVRVTAKAVQEAIKAGTATPELLEAEKRRIQEREDRYQQLDKDKVQAAIHSNLCTLIREEPANMVLTDADMVAARLLVYESLDYHNRNLVREVLFKDQNVDQWQGNDTFYQLLSQMNDAQFSYLIRMAITGKDESKQPSHFTGHCLYKIAESCGVPVSVIEDAQRDKAEERQARQQLRLKDLDKKIKRLQQSTLKELAV